MGACKTSWLYVVACTVEGHLVGLDRQGGRFVMEGSMSTIIAGIIIFIIGFGVWLVTKLHNGR